MYRQFSFSFFLTKFPPADKQTRFTATKSATPAAMSAASRDDFTLNLWLVRRQRTWCWCFTSLLRVQRSIIINIVPVKPCHVGIGGRPWGPKAHWIHVNELFVDDPRDHFGNNNKIWKRYGQRYFLLWWKIASYNHETLSHSFEMLVPNY